jgi:NADH:ubiquinone oxidoreductase subunit 4 (subunit M)
MIPLVAAIIWLGVYPAPVLRRMQTAAERFVSYVDARRDVRLPEVADRGTR